ncbi:MAG: hypothetical protein VX587_00610 [Thermoproteota archaeon]|nr:hypothetical protein [Thermoproteota archaeon]
MKDFNSDNEIKNEKTTYRLNHRLLIISLIILAFIGTTYFWLDERVEFFELGWILIFSIWYVWLIVSLVFIFSRKKLGYLLGGILAWITIGFLLLDNFHTVFGTSVIASKPSLNITMKNFIEIIIAGLSVFSAHNSFHKFKIS